MANFVLNLSKIEKRMNELKYSKVDVCRKANLSRTTFDGLLNGRDSKISTLIEVAKVLKSPIGYFFDETETPSLNIEADNSSNVAVGENISIVDFKEIQSKAEYLEKILEEKERIIKIQEKLISKMDSN